MNEAEDPVRLLESGLLYRFADWPNDEVPRVAAGVYTVWTDDGRLLYVGMSGRGEVGDGSDGKRRGLWTRLNSHASGRRSGDQFCVYISDRLVTPHLTRSQREQLAVGTLSLDGLAKAWIREHLSYRFIVVPDSATAYEVERQVQRGALSAGPPLLNPLKPSAT